MYPENSLECSEFSRVFWHFFGHEGKISCQVTGPRQMGKGLVVPCTYTVIANQTLKVKLDLILHKNNPSMKSACVGGGGGTRNKYATLVIKNATHHQNPCLQMVFQFRTGFFCVGHLIVIQTHDVDVPIFRAIHCYSIASLQEEADYHVPVRAHFLPFLSYQLCK